MFFFKQKTAYEMRISDWSSDVCSSDLSLPAGTYVLADGEPGPALIGWQTAQYRFTRYREPKDAPGPRILLTGKPAERNSVEPGQSVSVHVDLGGSLIPTQKLQSINTIIIITQRRLQFSNISESL